MNQDGQKNKKDREKVMTGNRQAFKEREDKSEKVSGKGGVIKVDQQNCLENLD